MDGLTRIPILKVGRVLIVPIQVDMDDQTVIHLQERILSELERTGAFDRSLMVLISPTGTGYVNYVATAAVQYLALGDVATRDFLRSELRQLLDDIEERVQEDGNRSEAPGGSGTAQH